MQTKERIASCLTDLEAKAASVDRFQARLRHLIESLKAQGMTSGGLEKVLHTLESVLQDYNEISASCRRMVEGLREVGDHVDKIEDGRQKILTGVEAILQNLSHLDRLAKNGMQLGTAKPGSKPKKILLVRLSPGDESPLKSDDEDEDPAGDTVVH